MFVRRLVPAAIAVALSTAALADPLVGTRLIGPPAALGVADPLLAVEANRTAIVSRLVAEHAEALAASGVSAEAFGRALESLRADQLLAASLVSTFADVTAIVAQQPLAGHSAAERFVAITPTAAALRDTLPAADAYLVRDDQSLSLVDRSQLALLQQGQVVGYFPSVTSAPSVISALPGAPTQSSDAASGASRVVEPKDGSGSGSNSWIGYVAGGNAASGSGSAVAAGRFNLASGQNAFVGAGQSNEAAGISSLVIGGFDNHATVIDSTVVAGAGNRAEGARSVIVGGGYNLASGQWSFIGGGGRQTGSGNAGNAVQDHIAGGNWSAIAGGIGNRITAAGNYAFIGGGAYNVASNAGAVVVGGNNGIPGQGNTASGLNSFVGAGFLNVAGGAYSAIFAGHEGQASGDGAIILGGHGPGLGFGNVASGQNSLVTTGYSNVASGNFASIISGHDSVASGVGSTAIGITNVASGDYATVVSGHDSVASGLGATAIGVTNTASGVGSIAIGIQALTEAPGPVPHDGAFVFSDGSSGNFRSTGAHTFNVLATGGARVVTAATNTFGEAVPTAGVTLAAGGGSWSSLSDRAAKRDLLAADPVGVLAKVAAMPIYTWRYITEVSGASHMGPMAQDFHRAFGLGDSDKTITNVDADGVALAAIQGLKQMLDRKDAQLQRMEKELAAIKARLDGR